MQYLSKGEGVSQTCAAATDIWQCLVMILLRFLRAVLLEMIFSTRDARSLARRQGLKKPHQYTPGTSATGSQSVILINP